MSNVTWQFGSLLRHICNICTWYIPIFTVDNSGPQRDFCHIVYVWVWMSKVRYANETYVKHLRRYVSLDNRTIETDKENNIQHLSLKCNTSIEIKKNTSLCGPLVMCSFYATSSRFLICFYFIQYIRSSTTGHISNYLLYNPDPHATNSRRTHNLIQSDNAVHFLWSACNWNRSSRQKALSKDHIFRRSSMSNLRLANIIWRHAWIRDSECRRIVQMGCANKFEC